MHININDKFIAIKPMWFLEEGTIVTVTDIDDNIISFTFGENNSNNGYMDYNTFNEHFKKVEEMTAKIKAPTITEEYIAEIMENSEFEIHTVFDKCTVVSCRLPNGFVITESSACVSPENYDEDMGAEICFDKIASKIWELEGYRLQQWLWEEENNFCCEDCDGCHCDCEDEEEVNEDDMPVDCEHCDSYDCPDHPMNRFSN